MTEREKKLAFFSLSLVFRVTTFLATKAKKASPAFSSKRGAERRNPCWGCTHCNDNTVYEKDIQPRRRRRRRHRHVSFS